MGVLRELLAHRRALLARYEEASRARHLGIGGAGLLGRDDYQAIASCYWVMLQYSTAHLVGHAVFAAG